MKILHTADWHLGKSFHSIDLLDEQEYILSKFVEIVKEKKTGCGNNCRGYL